MPLIAVISADFTVIAVTLDLALTALFLVDSKLVRKFIRDPDDRQILLPNTWNEVASQVPLFTMLLPFSLPGVAAAALLLTHAFRAPAILRSFGWHSKTVASNKRMKSVLIISAALLVIHFVACLFVGIWPNQTGDIVTRYTTALYYCITTLTTVGYGDITPQTNLTRVFAMVLMVMGVAGYSFLISQMSQYLVTRDSRKEEEKENLERLDSLFRHYAIPAPLQTQALSYFAHISKRQSNDVEHKLLDSFPKGLKAELQVYMNIKPLSHVSLFKGCSMACLADAAHRLEQFSVAPGETIVHAGEDGEEMFVIGWGRVLVHVGDKHITELKDGNCFGEMSLINVSTQVGVLVK